MMSGSKKRRRRVRNAKLPALRIREVPSRVVWREPMTTSNPSWYQGTSLSSSWSGVDWSMSENRIISPRARWMPSQTAAGLPPWGISNREKSALSWI